MELAAPSGSFLLTPSADTAFGERKALPLNMEMSVPVTDTTQRGVNGVIGGGGGGGGEGALGRRSSTF